MAEKNSTVGFNLAQLRRAPFSVRHSARARPPAQISGITSSPASPAISPPAADASKGPSRSAVAAQPAAPRAQDPQGPHLAQALVASPVVGRKKTTTGDRAELIERLKSPDWMVSNRRGQHISKGLRDAVSSLIAVCRMLEKIDERLGKPSFKSKRESQHVEVFSKRLLQAWADLSLVLECYDDDEAWARSMISRTAYEITEVVLDLKELLERASKVLDFQDRRRTSDADDNLPQYWLTQEAVGRYQAVEEDLIAVALAVQQLDEQFARLPKKSRAAARVGDIVPELSGTGSPRKPVPVSGKPVFQQQKHVSELQRLHKQASSIHVCLRDLGKLLVATELQRQFVVTILDESATVLEKTMQHAGSLKAWETGLHRSRHHFLKAHAKLQDIASIASTLEFGELAVPQKIAAGIYASFDSVINIVMDLAVNGATGVQASQKRQEIQSGDVTTISSPTTVTPRYKPENPDRLRKKTDAPALFGEMLLQEGAGDALAKGISGATFPKQAPEQAPASKTVNVATSTSPLSQPPRKKANVGERARRLSGTWQEIENAATTGKDRSTE